MSPLQAQFFTETVLHHRNNKLFSYYKHWNDIDGGTKRVEEKPVPLLFCLPLVPHGLTRA